MTIVVRSHIIQRDSAWVAGRNRNSVHIAVGCIDIGQRNIRRGDIDGILASTRANHGNIVQYYSAARIDGQACVAS